MPEYTLADAIIIAYGSRYSENGRRLVSSFADWVLTNDDFEAAKDVLPADAPWQMILEFAGRHRAILMRVDCDFTQNHFEMDFHIET